MKQKTFSILPIILIMIVLFLMPTLLNAQVNPPPNDPGGDPAPIDGGVSIVAAACAGYLARKRKQFKMK